MSWYRFKDSYWHGLLLITLTVIGNAIVHGIGLGGQYDLTLYTQLLRTTDPFVDGDIYIRTFQNSLPLWFKVFGFFPHIWTVPFFHLVSGFLIKFCLFASFYVLVHRKFRSEMTVALSLIMFSGIVPGVEKYLSGLQVVSSLEIQEALYFSFRQIATVFLIVSVLAFMSKRYVVASAMLAFGAYSHIWNAVHLYLVSALVLGLKLILDVQNYKQRIRHFAAFTVPFLMMITPLILRFVHQRYMSARTPISVFDWWRLIIKNEPDDSSIIFIVHNLLKPFYFLHIIGLLLVSFLSVPLLIGLVHWAHPDGRKKVDVKLLLEDDWLFFLACPWLILCAGYMCEFSIKYCPDFIGDLVIPLQFFKRALGIPPLFFIPISAYVIYRIAGKGFHALNMNTLSLGSLQLNQRTLALMLIFIVTVCQGLRHEGRFRAQLSRYLPVQTKTFDYLEETDNPTYHEEKKWLYPGNPRLSKNGAIYCDQGKSNEKNGNILAAATAYQKALITDPSSAILHNKLGIVFSLNGDARRATREFLRAGELALRTGYPATDLLELAGLVSDIPLEAVIDIGLWMKTHIPPNQGFFNPPYIKEWRAIAERSCFLSEKTDGTITIYNRRYTTIYLQRFGEITKGLTYDDLPGIVSEGDVPYAIIRRRYLSLTGSDFAHLHRLYPDYRYVLTENVHILPFRILYQNDYFVLYDLDTPASH